MTAVMDEIEKGRWEGQLEEKQHGRGSRRWEGQ